MMYKKHCMRKLTTTTKTNRDMKNFFFAFSIVIDKTACCQKFYFMELMRNLIKGPSCHAKVVEFRFCYNKFGILIFFITILHGNMFIIILRSYHNIKNRL